MSIQYLYAVILSIFIAGFGISNTSKQSAQIAYADPCNTVLIFDIHGVLFSRKWSATISTFSRLLCNGYIFRNLYRLHQKYPYNFTALRDAIEPVTNLQEPYKKLWNAIKACKEQGIPVYLFTNSRPETHAQLIKTFPELLGLINGTIHVGPHTNPHYSWLYKPHPLYYQQCKHILCAAGHGDKRVIFFDDKAKNAQEGTRQGWDSVHVATSIIHPHVAEESCLHALHARGIQTTPKEQLPNTAFQAR